MKGKRNIGLWIALAFIGAIVLWVIITRNSLAGAKTNINGAWGQVENKYRERMALYDGVIKAINKSAGFEDTVLTNIVKMRSRVPNLEQNNPQSLADANRQLDQIKGTILNINVENYPTLQTPQAIRDFQVQIGRMEAILSTAIMDWNNSVTSYNGKLVKFPANIIAGMFGYKEMANYKAANGAKDYNIDFNKK